MEIKQHYWRVDCIGDNGFSLSVGTNDELQEDEVIDACVKMDLLNSADVKEFNVQAEEITDDNYEMSHWKDRAHDIDI